ncbi:putative cytokinetic ring protein SteA [Aeromicrobium sp. Leaf350]|uniref:putative cytokinetic ring protein SteA n=1 Tax=Aeromicrobium sp. Leaf350 TaxID=2876565 RepID=UPI001E4FE619|nr:putative cytokinetic ring protein SteA [Aeromicrobium sp. Leaf350]
MSIFKRGGGRSSDAPGVSGPARIARGGAEVTAGVRAGDVAIIDRTDLDADDAAELVKLKVAAVVNVAASTTGKFPSVGPELLAEAGIPLVDQAGEGVVTRLRSGDLVRVHEGKIFRDGVLVASGIARDGDQVRADYSEASSDFTTRLDTLSVNASEHLRREHAMLLDGARVPRLSTRLKGRAVVVVSDSFDAAADLKALKRFVLDRDPVMVGAGKGADLILKAGYQPDVVVGSVEGFSSAVLDSTRELVVTTASGQIQTPERLEKHQKDVVRFVADGEDADLAILLADANGASVIVHAGAAPTLGDFLGQSPGLVGPAFVVRLRSAAKLVDAKVVAHVTTGRISAWPIVLLILSAIVAMAVALSLTTTGGDVTGWVSDQLGDLGSWIEGLRS